ncbi:efflux RND transporter permease subunit [Pendulispora albinea]|uniref:Efflux RND transporter permease subunit n=1 Tax=Pendulispora albinea TaxID=2741071 RepID=A0ABZ2LVZ5_9BACT
MNLSAIAIKRPVFTVMVTFALMVFGLMGLSRLGTDLFPDVDFPVVSVNIAYPGASPTEVETLVTKQIEDAVVSLNGLDTVRSLSREGLSTTIVIFKLGTDLQEAATQVRERVAQTRFKLPDEVKEPAISRLDVGATPVLTYTLSGGGRSLPETGQLARDVIKPALEQVEGVAAVNVNGGAEREVHVDLNLAKIDALKLSPAAILAQLKAENITVPAGHFDEGPREVAVRTIGEFRNVDDIRHVIVANTPDGSGVRLSDIAEVEDGYKELKTRIRSNGVPAVSFEIVKQSGRNTVAVSDGIKAKLAKLQATLPAGVRANPIIDQSKFIRENADDVQMSIVFGGAMAILVILVFMLDLRSTLISALALPTSVVSTFFLMYLLGFTLNMMTLLGLSLAIGLLIDDAVVVRENITKHLERGADPKTAALEGTKEIALSVLATTMTVVAVFLPVAFMSGIVGQFFRQFGLTIVASVLVSLFVAFTLDPMLSSRFSKAHVPGARDRFAWIKAPIESVHQGTESVYRAVLGWSVTHRWTVLGLSFAAFVGMIFIAGLMGSDFVNAEDRGQFVTEVELPAGTSLDETARLSEALEKKVLEDPRFVTVFSTLGPNGESNKINWRIVTVPKHARDVGIQVLKERVRTIAYSIAPDVKVSVTDPAFVEGAGTQAPIMVLVRAPSYEELEPLARQFRAALKSIPGVQDPQMKYTPGRPELKVGIDRDKAARAQVPVSQLAATLRASIEGQEGSKLRQGKDEVPILVRLGENDRASVDDVMRMTVWSPKGPMALQDLATVERGEGPNVIERQDRERQIQIWASPLGRSLGEIVPEMKAAFGKIPMPPGASYRLDGQIKQMNESNSSMGLALLLAIVFIYIVLASQFESFIHPLTIMLTLPLAIIGAIVALFMSGNSVAMGSLIGIILLMGLVTKNAILLLDRAIVRVREHGETPLQAILEAGPERLRPILMTSAAMILGMLPTAISRGEGSEFRAPMGIAVIGGVVSSTLLSLVVVPAVYLLIEGLKARVARWFGGEARTAKSTPPSPERSAPHAVLDPGSATRM